MGYDIYTADENESEYFRVSVWEMPRLTRLMAECGMLAKHDGDEGIQSWKLVFNDGEHVTAEEIEVALDRLGSKPTALVPRFPEEQEGVRIDDPNFDAKMMDAAIRKWPNWIEFLRKAEKLNGFRVF